MKFPYFSLIVSLTSTIKKNYLKNLILRSKGNNESINLYIKGNYNILNKKNKFKNISYNNFKSSKEDLMYFKRILSKLLF